MVFKSSPGNLLRPRRARSTSFRFFLFVKFQNRFRAKITAEPAAVTHYNAS